MISFIVNQVSEAIQVGARAIKEHRISIEEVHHHLQELDTVVAAQKQVDAVLGNLLLYTLLCAHNSLFIDCEKLDLL